MKVPTCPSCSSGPLTAPLPVEPVAVTQSVVATSAPSAPRASTRHCWSATRLPTSTVGWRSFELADGFDVVVASSATLVMDGSAGSTLSTVCESTSSLAPSATLRV